MIYLFGFLFFFVYCVFGVLFVLTFFGKSFLVDFYLFGFNGLDFSFSLVFDFLSLGFFCCVSFISGVVFLYSVFYMEGTVDMRRFCWLVFLFVVSMFLLVFSGNFFVTMVGWDGLGLVSFCLVIFYANSSSLESGLVTVFSNRVGDVFFLLSFLFFGLNGSFFWDFFSFSFFDVFLFFLFFGAITKSAQVPFSAWLPAAMAAPTPVSSLVHSSTLVTAGVYVLIRFNYLFICFSYNFVKVFFLMTMVVAGFCSIVEMDLKKIVAMSTLSQLGMMMFVLSSGAWIMSFIHMIVHAFFKSMLFLSTGSLMGQMGGLQDSRFYGASFFSFSSFVFFVVSCLCLGGFPFFLGFYSKDFIISSISFGEGLFFYMVFLLGCVFTVMYSFRLIYMAYFIMYKYTNHYVFLERSEYLFPVSMLFFKCFVLGGGIYWLFLSNSFFFFTFFDLFLGIIIFFMGNLLFFLVRFVYGFFFSLSNILFLRWGATSSMSFYFKKFFNLKFEGTWMEVMGGMGLYKYLYLLNSSFMVFRMISVGIMIFVFLLVTFYLF